MHKTRKFLFLFLIMATLYSCSKEEVEDTPAKDFDINVVASRLSLDEHLTDVFASKAVIEYLVLEAQQDLLDSDKTIFLTEYEEALYSNDFMKIATLLNTEESLIKEFFLDHVSDIKELAADFPEILNLSDEEALNLDSLVLSKDSVVVEIENKYQLLLDMLRPSSSQKSDSRCAFIFVMCSVKTASGAIAASLACSAVAPPWVVSCVGFVASLSAATFSQCTANFLDCIK